MGAWQDGWGAGGRDPTTGGHREVDGRETKQHL